MNKTEFLKEFEILSNENQHDRAIKLACEYFEHKKATKIMEHINVLHILYGFLTPALAQMRDDIWDGVSGKYYMLKKENKE